LNRRIFLLGVAIGSAPLCRAHADTLISPRSVIVTGFRGTAKGDPEVDTVCRLLESGEAAGVLLLRRNIVSPEQVLKLSLAFREAAGAFVPIVAVDQEGGEVTRLDATNGFTNWMSAADLANTLPKEQEVFDYYVERARELSSVGINLNFGPVVDLNRNPLNPIIGRLDRSFGLESDTVVRCASAFIDAHRAAGVETCCKHFPGHGSSETDSHLESTDVSQSWSEDELIPFQTLAASGRMDALMTSHLNLQRFSDGGKPVSLSTEALNFVRNKIGFQGAVFTDDMQMSALTQTYPEAAAAVAAISAGNTFLIYANHNDEQDVTTAARVNQAVAEAVANGAIDPVILENRAHVASAFLGRLR
jgi:beta-N-acetylhexosaminidase